MSNMVPDTYKVGESALFSEPQGEIVFEGNGYTRLEEQWSKEDSQLVDIHSDNAVQIHFVRVKANNAPSKIILENQRSICTGVKAGEMGVLLKIEEASQKYTVWIPNSAGKFQFDTHQRFAKDEQSAFSYQWEFFPYVSLTITRPETNGETATIPYVVINDRCEETFDELNWLTDIERRAYFKSDWFFSRVPSDIWKYLVNGSIYDSRAYPGIGKRFKCQQCAYAWWTYFDFLHEKTTKVIYGVMKDEIALSVLTDMTSEGAWRHGFWSDEMETHARFHLDGLHLLISQYEKTRDLIWIEAAERGVSFVSSSLMEEFDDGSLWFLHDTIEATKNKHSVKSRIFGKSLGNSVCLNTHVQALTVLHRLQNAVPDKKIYREMFEKGTKAFQRVLEHQPGEVFFKIFMPFLIRNRTWAHGKFDSRWVLRALGGEVLRRIYWPLRRMFPRVVQPGGFIERDLTSSFFLHNYHLTNIKDFLTLYQQIPLPWLRSYIENGVVCADELIQKLELRNALKLSRYYIEYVDILYLYNTLFNVSMDVNFVEQKIYEETGGYSLDYYVLKKSDET
ncbi:MAG: hypothetical protein NPIRA02_38670 [Nitrospirales bacterium]|nr:MAG: hypothetical protein NPIRA02_38670 [Nitrospirales bacterium]